VRNVKGGSPVLIIDRGRPVARLEPVTTGLGAEPGGTLSRLVPSGVARPRRAELPRMLFTDQPPRAKAGAPALEALLEERRQGR
jgi:antitoxin (DNA-binding transcriptional repressor) of toxin-antitoxin stability system